VEHTPQATRLFAIELDGQGGYEPGGVLRRIERQLQGEEWERLETMLGDDEFWRSPTALVTLGMDGANWIIEASEGDRYHVVDRWGGSTIGEYLVTLTGLEVGPVY
jgi:hypothetical protein